MEQKRNTIDLAKRAIDLVRVGRGEIRLRGSCAGLGMPERVHRRRVWRAPPPQPSGPRWPQAALIVVGVLEAFVHPIAISGAV